jgi:hypothetical protein
MTKPHPAHLAFTGLLVLLAGLPLASRAGEPLIVVEDRGGVGAAVLRSPESPAARQRTGAAAHPDAPVPATPADEAAMLPVRSAKLAGTVARRDRAPGLRPFVVIGDDEASGPGCAAPPLCANAARSAWWSTSRPRRAWRGCALVPGVPLAPVAGDDLADRLGLRHYPALITATGIEQ